jgi:uncharacterized membrane protein YdjX (TVP38/TMEM64 family)
VAALFVAFFAFRFDGYLTLQALHEHDAMLRSLVARSPVLVAASFTALYALTIAISLPGAGVLTIAGGFLFGLWLGTGFAILGATAGAVLFFCFARFVVGDALRTRAGPFVSRMVKGFERNAFSYLLFLRLIPAFPFWAVNLAAAALGVPIRSFVAATLIGIIPGTLAFAAIGDGLQQYVAADPAIPLSQVMGWPALALRGALALVAFLPLIVRWVIQHRPPSPG